MFKWAPFAFVRITAAFGAGISMYTLLNINLVWINEVFFVAACIYGVLILLQYKFKQAMFTWSTGFLGLCCMFLFGLSVTQLHSEKFYPGHLLHETEQVIYYQVVLNDYVVDKEKTVSTTARILHAKTSTGWKAASGKIQLVIQKSNHTVPVKYGDVLIVKGTPQRIGLPMNPGAFNFKTFQENRQVFFQQYLTPGNYLITGKAPPSYLVYAATRVRNRLDAVFKSFFPNQKEKSIASALVLGVKDYLPQDLKQTYSNTGTMHVLAVSGLHVGLLFVVLTWLFSRFKLGKIHGYVNAVLILLFLWSYAFITGLTPSVLRAVFMFSIVLLATVFNRRTNIYNSVAVAAFCLLIYNPFYLYEVSFQLSFLAVLGIVYIQPRLYKQIYFKNWLPDKIWMLVSVSVAAQISTLPVSLYYFHQFPLYFWLANIPVIPLATVVLWSGLALLVFSWVPVFSEILAFINQQLVSFMNWLIALMNALPQAVIPVTISTAQMWVLYGMIAAILIFFAVKRLFYLTLALLLLIIFSAIHIQKIRQQATHSEFIVYFSKSASATVYIEGMQVFLQSDTVDPVLYKTVLQPHWQQNGLKPATPLNQLKIPKTILPDGNTMVVWQGLRILFLQNPPQVWPATPEKLDFVILKKNVKVNPEELLTHFKISKVILDSTNKPWYRRKMGNAFEALNQVYYPVPENGAFVYSL